LEICVYEELNGNLFVHHDIPLPSFPLCLAHGTINSDGGAGNYVAVGTFDPGIEVWNADVLNVLEPTVMLGGQDTSAADAKWAKKFGMKNTPKSKFKSKSGNGLKEGSHTDAVMSLSWNQIHRQVIASGSADKTVKLWDITKADDATGGVAATFTIHSDKVQSTAWHPSEGSILATGSYDRTVCILDARSPQSACKKVKIPADCEAIAWDPHHPHLLTAASEDGSVLCWDIRKFDSSTDYWNFVAHEFGGCSDISYNS
jgi:periodic tryptophan protein 1